MAENPQPTPESEVKKSRGFGSFVVWEGVAAMVYMLSSGPAVWLLNRNGPVKSRTVFFTMHYFFCPVLWAYNNTSLHKPLGVYWHLWCPEFFDSSGN